MVLQINKLRTLSGAHLASLLIVHENDTSIAIKILMSTITIQQRTEFLNCVSNMYTFIYLFLCIYFCFLVDYKGNHK